MKEMLKKENKLKIFCLMASVAVAQELTPVAPEGLNYSYKFATAYFKADEKSAFMDNYMLELEAAPQACGTDDLYVALNDLARVYAPDFAVTVERDAITLTHVYHGAADGRQLRGDGQRPGGDA